MFTILGGDGKEYGPVSAEQLRAWITAGRANLDTRAKLAGETEWRRLGDIPEFNGTADATTPPTLNATGAAVADALVPADRLMRLASAALDFLISVVCALPGALVLGTAFLDIVIAVARGQQPDVSQINPGRLLIGFALLGLASFTLLLVQIYLVSTRGQTIAKRILGLRIVRYADGSNPGFVHGWLLRALVPGIIGILPMVGNLFTIVNYCFIFRDDRRCLHDLIADTRVVKVTPPVS
jgi:uncharacterized RDD family membrane protein YckC